MKRMKRGLFRIAGLSVLLALFGAQDEGFVVGRVHASVARGKCDGISRPQQISGGFRSLSIGRYHSLLVKNDGSLWAWGANDYGGLGDGTKTEINVVVPKQIGTGFRSAVAGNFYSLAVKDDGTLWAWGWNIAGQLGDGTKTNRLLPTLIGSGFQSVAAGRHHSLALKEDGSLWVWGSNIYGQLGDGTTNDIVSPKQIAGDYAAVVAGEYNTVALGRDGRLWAWGREQYVQQAIDAVITQDRKVVSPKEIGTGFTAVAVGASHGLALKGDGSLWTWGNGYGGRLGDGTETDRFTPAKIDDGFVAVAAGRDHSMALKSGGSVWAWGDNFCQQTGDVIPVEDNSYPDQVQGLDAVASIFAGSYLSLAVKKDGTVWIWGARYIVNQLESALADRAKSP